MEMLAGVTDCGRSRKWDSRGRLALGFKLRCGSHDKKNHAALGLPLPCSLGSRQQDVATMQSSVLAVWKNAEDAAGRKGVEGPLLVGHEKVPCGFGLRTGDPDNTADGAGNQGRPAS